MNSDLQKCTELQNKRRSADPSSVEVWSCLPHTTGYGWLHSKTTHTPHQNTIWYFHPISVSNWHGWITAWSRRRDRTIKSTITSQKSAVFVVYGKLKQFSWIVWQVQCCSEYCSFYCFNYSSTNFTTFINSY